MEILIFSLNATAPAVLCMALGAFSRHINILDAETAKKMNGYCFQVFLPTLLFFNIYNIDFKAEFSTKLVVFSLASVLILISVLCAIFFSLFKDKSKAAAYIHICYRSNYAMFGVVLAQSMLGEAGMLAASMLIPVSIIPFNVAAVILLSFCAANENGSTPRPNLMKVICLNILKNPLIISCFFAVLVSLSGLSLPVWLYAAVKSVAGVTSPFCLIVLGAQISWSSLRKDVKTVAAISVMRLIVVPAIMLTASVLMGFRGAELAALFALFASPCANSAAIMAQKYNVYPGLTVQAMAMTTIFCGFTAFLGISILRYLQYF